MLKQFDFDLKKLKNGKDGAFWSAKCLEKFNFQNVENLSSKLCKVNKKCEIF